MNKIFFSQNIGGGEVIPSISTGIVNTVGTDTLTVDNNQLISSGNSTIIEYGTLYTNDQQLNFVKNEVGVECVSTTGSIVDGTYWNDTIINLYDNTTYYYRGYATNNIGTGLGTIKNVTTDEFIGTVPTVTTGGVTLIGANSMVVENNELVSSGTSEITEYGLLYATSSRLTKGNLGVLCVSNSESLSENTTWSNNISGLVEDTTYYYRAYGTNSAGTGCGDILSQKTSGGDSPPPPSGYEIYFEVNWVDTVNNDSDDGLGGYIQLYCNGSPTFAGELSQFSKQDVVTFNVVDETATYSINLETIDAWKDGNVGEASYCWYCWGETSHRTNSIIDGITEASKYCVDVLFSGMY